MAITERFIASGASVVIWDIDEEAIKTAINKINSDKVSYQKVDVVNINTGDRWSTYVIPGGKGVFQLNGGGARLGEVGDPCVIMGYKNSSHFEGAIVAYTNKYNKIVKSIIYGN